MHKSPIWLQHDSGYSIHRDESFSRKLAAVRSSSRLLISMNGIFPESIFSRHRKIHSKTECFVLCQMVLSRTASVSGTNHYHSHKLRYCSISTTNFSTNTTLHTLKKLQEVATSTNPRRCGVPRDAIGCYHHQIPASFLQSVVSPFWQRF